MSNMPYITGEGSIDAGHPLTNLALGKCYRAIPDDDMSGWLRVWDDFGEDCLDPE